VERKFPDVRFLKSLLASSGRDSQGIERRLSRILTIWDMREAARRRVPRSVFDYVDGAADQELTLSACRRLFSHLQFAGSVLRDVSEVDTSCTVLGKAMALPFAFAPTGFTRMMHPDGEVAVARVAQRAGIPYALSTVGTTSIEHLAMRVPGCCRWFQLYVPRDRRLARMLVERAADSGYEALMVTVDAPVAGRRLRDLRNGFSTPPSLSAGSIAGFLARPTWLFNFLTADPLSFESIRPWGGGASDLSDLHFDPSLCLADIDWLRSLWSGSFVVKGVQSPDDAVVLEDAGVDAIVLSNHGGRQLDRAVPPVKILSEVLSLTKGRAEIWLDGGVMSGSDVVAALALGARCVLVGRAYLYGLMTGGEPGVERVVDIVASEIRRTMQLLGAKSVDELHRGLVLLP